jgi:hypothetical protein
MAEFAGDSVCIETLGGIDLVTELGCEVEPEWFPPADFELVCGIVALLLMVPGSVVKA